MPDTISLSISQDGDAITINVQEARDAYQLAVVGGYTGTREEWLEQLNSATAADIAAAIVAAAEKPAPVGADLLGLVDTENGNALAFVTLANLFSALGGGGGASVGDATDANGPIAGNGSVLYVMTAEQLREFAGLNAGTATVDVAQLLGGLVSNSDERGNYVAGGSGVVPEGPNKIQFYLDPSHGGQPQFTIAKAEGSLPNRFVLGRSNGIFWRDSAYSDHAGGVTGTGIVRDSLGVVAVVNQSNGTSGDVKMRRARFSSESVGTATLVNGTVTVANTSVTAKSLIIPVRQAAAGTIGDLTWTVSAGTSFTINSSSLTDGSTVAFVIVEQAT